jgi:hypothetical protein
MVIPAPAGLRVRAGSWLHRNRTVVWKMLLLLSGCCPAAAACELYDMPQPHLLVLSAGLADVRQQTLVWCYAPCVSVPSMGHLAVTIASLESVGALHRSTVRESVAIMQGTAYQSPRLLGGVFLLALPKGNHLPALQQAGAQLWSYNRLPWYWPTVCGLAGRPTRRLGFGGRHVGGQHWIIDSRCLDARKHSELGRSRVTEGYSHPFGRLSPSTLLCMHHQTRPTNTAPSSGGLAGH